MTDIGSIAALGTILGIWAHPDDETYLSGGVMATAVDNGQRVVVVSATAGERGTDDPEAWPPERLEPVRRWEATAALHAVGIDDHRWLDLGDGTLEDHCAADGARRVAEIIADVEPDTILTFGPDGITGHPDHRTISAWVDEANRMTGARARILHATNEQTHCERYLPLYERFGLLVDPDLPAIVPVSDLAVDVRLCGSSLDRKLVALRAMATQTMPVIELFGADEYERWVSQEAFVEAS